MQDIYIISNRLPMTVTRNAGSVSVTPSAGGVATGLGSVFRKYDARWIGWPGIAVNKGDFALKESIKALLDNQGCIPVFLTRNDVEKYYKGFSNKVLWPLFHYFQHYTEFDESYWRVYEKVNRSFCDILLETAEPDAKIFVQDYHLMLLPQMIRRELPDATIGFFLHIPFPSYELFRILPWRDDLLKGLLGSDLIGFHTYEYTRHFLDSVLRVLGHDHYMGQISYEKRLIRADAFPMGIDFDRFNTSIQTHKVQKEIRRIKRDIGTGKALLSADRLDFSKGIPLRLEAFGRFLAAHPDSRGKVTLVLVAVPSRSTIPSYITLKKHINEQVGEINGRYGTIDWTPIRFLYSFLPFNTLLALYNICDIAVVTPIRDGMNLMAKEYLATKADGTGVLILSEFAGASKELGEAILINPHDMHSFIRALECAMDMPEEEQIRRVRRMQERIRRYDIIHWIHDFNNRLDEIKHHQAESCADLLSSVHQDKMIQAFRDSPGRLLLLDYDGTLVPFSDKPEAAIPDPELLQLLESLGRLERNTVIIISGRDRNVLEEWFGESPVELIAEHGAWLKTKKDGWERISELKNDWKDSVRDILTGYVDRTPGSFIEEKEYALAWHYRTCDPELGNIRAMELRSDLEQMSGDLVPSLIEGDKVIEIKNAEINKGLAASVWLKKQKWDFVLGIGDDQTDEDLFRSLPGGAYSIKVGTAPSRAHYRLQSFRQIRELLSDCMAVDRE